MLYRTYISKERKQKQDLNQLCFGLTQTGVTSSNRILFTQPFWKSLLLKENINKARLSSQLPHINSKTWITTAVSQEWLKNCFVPEAEKYCWGNFISRFCLSPIMLRRTYTIFIQKWNWCFFGQTPVLQPILTDRLAFLTHSVYMRPSFQGLLWDEFDGLNEDKLKILILMSWWADEAVAILF